MILIIQNGYVSTHIKKYLIDEEVEIVRSLDPKEMSQIDLMLYSMMIVLGGYQQIKDINQHPNLILVLDLIKQCLKINKPVLGICLGCQLIGYALGCNIITSEKLKIGCDTQILNFKNIFRCHYDYVEPCDQIEILETFDQMPYLFRHRNLLGIQCHPDIPPENIGEYYPDPKCISYGSRYKDEINEQNKKLMRYLLEYLQKN